MQENKMDDAMKEGAKTSKKIAQSAGRKALEMKFGKQQVQRVRSGMSNNILLSVTYVPQINEYRGNRTIQIRICNYR